MTTIVYRTDVATRPIQNPMNSHKIALAECGRGLAKLRPSMQGKQLFEGDA
jgi:hypothetical protein